MESQTVRDGYSQHHPGGDARQLVMAGKCSPNHCLETPRFNEALALRGPVEHSNQTRLAPRICSFHYLRQRPNDLFADLPSEQDADDEAINEEHALVMFCSRNGPAQ